MSAGPAGLLKASPRGEGFHPSPSGDTKRKFAAAAQAAAYPSTISRCTPCASEMLTDSVSKKQERGEDTHRVASTRVQIRLGLLRKSPANTENVAQSSREIGFHMLPAVATNSHVLPPLWQPAGNRRTESTTKKNTVDHSVVAVFLYPSEKVRCREGGPRGF